MEDKIQWCINKHKETNHFYDEYLPYEFHLRMVVQNAKVFLPKMNNKIKFANSEIILACFGHDLIEDCRVSYNDCKDKLGEVAANIIYAVTNDKGKNRKDRAGENYYKGIQNTIGATFVKLCDRMANVQYSKLTKSRMFEMYKKENQQFVQYLYHDDYKVMFDYLDELFENNPLS